MALRLETPVAADGVAARIGPSTNKFHEVEGGWAEVGVVNVEQQDDVAPLGIRLPNTLVHRDAAEERTPAGHAR